LNLPSNSVRGPVRAWIEEHKHLFGAYVLEVGSRLPSSAPWAQSRGFAPASSWMGLDMQAGPGVDVVGDIHELPGSWAEKFTSVLCSEVLEHVARPWVAVPELFRVLQSGGHIIITVPFCFPVHAYPSDYYRYTDEGVKVLLGDAGFVDIKTSTAGEVPFILNDHGEPGVTRRSTYRHVLAVARKP